MDINNALYHIHEKYLKYLFFLHSGLANISLLCITMNNLEKDSI